MRNYKVNYFINGDETGEVMKGIFTEEEVQMLEGNRGIEMFDIEETEESRELN